jgi:hypothetical protein
MKDFPLNELLSATDLDKVQESLSLIFGHINRKLRLSPYPIRRCLPLVEAISRDFNDQVLRILTSYRLPYTPYDTFERILTQTTNTFRTWDDQIKEFTNVAREVMRKRNERFIPIKVVPAHARLQERTRYLMEWRKQHEQLAVMTGPTKGLGGVGMEVGGMDMEEEVKEAYEVVKRIDVLDVSVGADLSCLGICFSFKADVDGLQRVRKSGLRPKTRTMNVFRGWKIRLLRGCVIGSGLRGMQTRCSACFLNLTHCLCERR